MNSKMKPLFFNREMSWVSFNRRVLDQALDPKNPLLERLKFLAIVSSNFDEFFMVRMAMLHTARAMGIRKNCPSDMTVSQQIQSVSAEISEIVNTQYECLNKQILPSLAKHGLKILSVAELGEVERKAVREQFEDDIFPVLTPLKVEEEGKFPLFGNRVLHLIFTLKNSETQDELIGIVPIPNNLDRLVRIASPNDEFNFLLIEDIIQTFAVDLFKGYEITDHAVFRVTRNSDGGVDEERDEDFIDAMQEVIDERDFSTPVRLSVSFGKSKLTKILMKAMNLNKVQVYEVDGPLDLKPFMDLCFLDGLDHLKVDHWKAVPHPDLPDDAPLWETLAEKDILIHNPYQSFNPVIRLVEEAANDSRTLAIKITLYRTSGKSPIVQALIKAAKKGVQVTVLVELKARFDEEQNIQWARILEKAGAIVVYGVAHLKVHSKALLIVRKEELGVKRYYHLGTGNYNEKTASLYTDMSLLGSSEAIAFDLSLFFNTLTGYTSLAQYNRLSVAPLGIKSKLISLINREAERAQSGTGGTIYAKMNSLADPEVIEALYAASQVGVKINLNVRGICMLVPGVAGLSENINVVSIIDRYLEHTRMFCFFNGGNHEIFLSSADWMPRNLDKRIELFFPIEDRKLKKEIMTAFKVYFTDNTQSYQLQADGTWTRKNANGRRKVRAQSVFYHEAQKSDKEKQGAIVEIKPRRRPPKK